MMIAYKVVEDTPDHLLIEDLSNEYPMAMSLTNGAEELVKELFKFGLLTAGKKLLYIDTEGRTDELSYSGDTFLGFKFGGTP